MCESKDPLGKEITIKDIIGTVEVPIFKAWAKELAHRGSLCGCQACYVKLTPSKVWFTFSSCSGYIANIQVPNRFERFSPVSDTSRVCKRDPSLKVIVIQDYSLEGDLIREGFKLHGDVTVTLSDNIASYRVGANSASYWHAYNSTDQAGKEFLIKKFFAFGA